MADDGTPEQLYQLTVQINRLVKLFGGGGQSPFSDPGTSKPKLRGGIFDRNDMEKRSGLGAGISSIHKIVSTMHGGVDEFVYSLSNASRGLGVAAVALTALFEGAMKLTRTYNKMSDIGQTYGGSMLAMAAEAGRAGLTINQFAELMSRHSDLTAAMSNTLLRNYKVQEDSTHSTQRMSEAQRFVSRNLLDASAQISRFAGSAAAAAGASSRLSGRHSDTGTAASLLQSVLLGATSSAADLTHQQIAMGGSMGRAHAQIATLARTTTTSANAPSLVIALSEAGRVASEMASRQATMGATIDTLNERLTATSSVTSAVSGSMAALRSAQSRTSTLTTQYNKQIAEAAASATQYAVAQGAAGGASDKARNELDRHILDVTGTFAKLTEQQKHVSDLTATIDRGLASAASGVLTPHTLTKSSKTAVTTTEAVARSQAQFGSVVKTTTERLHGLTNSLGKQSDRTAQTGGAFAMMGNVAIKTGTALASVASSTDRVTQANTRQSLISAQISSQALKDGQGTTQTLAQLQLSVRNDLEPFGFFGMALSDLTDATSDYMQSMMLMGQLNQTSAKEQTRSVETMIGTASELSQVWGTSRDAIMKSTNAALQQANYSASMIGVDARTRDVGTQWIETLSAIPGELGPKLAQMFSEQTGRGRGGFINTSMGMGFIKTGMGELNNILVRRAERAMDNKQVITPKMQADAMGDAYNALRANRDRLEALSNDPELRPYAEEQLKLLSTLGSKYTKTINGMTVFDREKYQAAIKQAALDKGHQDMVTKNMLTFSSAIHKITGGFLDGFYSMIADMMGDDKDKTFQQTLITLQSTFKKLGTAVGAVIGVMFSPAAIDIASLLFESLDGMATIIGKIVKLLTWTIKEITAGVNGFRTYMSNIPGLGWMAPAKKHVDKNGNPISQEQAREAALTDEYVKLSLNEGDLQREANDKKKPEVQAAAKKKLQRLADIRKAAGMKKPGESLDAAAVIQKEDRAKADTPMSLVKSAIYAALPSYLIYSHFLNRGAARAATNQGGLFERLIKIMPFGRSRLGRATQAFEKSKAGKVLGEVTGLGGDGCCDKLSSGLSNIVDKLDLHGENAEKSAASIVEKTAETGEKIAETALKGNKATTALEDALKAATSPGERLGIRMAATANKVMSGVHKVISLPRTGFNAVRSGFNAVRSGATGIISRGFGGVKTGLSALKTAPGKLLRGAGDVLETMKGSLRGVGEGVASVATKGLSKDLLKMVPGFGLALGGVFAVQRAMQGDWLGATGELVSGIAGLVPGIGTAVDASIQAALFARDLYKANKTDADKKDSDKDDAAATKTKPVDPFADTGPRNPDDPGLNQSPAEANRDKIRVMAAELGNKVQADKAAGNVKAEQQDEKQLHTLLEILSVLGKGNKDMKTYNESSKLIQTMWPLQMSN